MSDGIKNQALKVKVYSPEEQKIRDEIAAAKEKLKGIRDRERAVRQQRRKDQIAVTFVLYRHLAALIKSGDQVGKKVVSDALAGLKAHDGYPQEKVDADKEALKRFLESPV